MDQLSESCSKGSVVEIDDAMKIRCMNERDTFSINNT